MRYQLKPISQQNWRAVTALKVAPHQEGLIEDNLVSLLEAAYDSSFKWTPIGLYVDSQLVGFAMIGAENPQERSIWFDRFMIDAHFQHRGYGHALFRAVLTYIKEHYKQVDTVYLSVHKQNSKAFPFYASFGFTHYDGKAPADHASLMTLTVVREK